MFKQEDISKIYESVRKFIFEFDFIHGRLEFYN